MKPETKFTKRNLMKKVRKDVKAYMEGSNNLNGIAHLGLYPKDIANARRTIIALQDLLNSLKLKHKKASNHIFGYKTELKSLFEQIDYNLNRYYTNEKSYLKTIDIQKIRIETLEKEASQFNQRRGALIDEVRVNENKKDTLLETINIMMKDMVIK